MNLCFSCLFVGVFFDCFLLFVCLLFLFTFFSKRVPIYSQSRYKRELSNLFMEGHITVCVTEGAIYIYISRGIKVVD